MTRTPPLIDDVIETADLTGPLVIAERMRDAIMAAQPPLSPEGLLLLEALSIECAHRLAELHARHLAAGESIPRRVHAIEERINLHDEWKGRMVGYNEGNGIIGGINDRIAKTPEERAVEKSHHARFRWGVTKITAVLVLVGGLTVAWVRHYAGSVRDEYDAAIVKRTEEKAERASLMKDVDRLFALLGLKRTP